MSKQHNECWGFVFSLAIEMVANQGGVFYYFIYHIIFSFSLFCSIEMGVGLFFLLKIKPNLLLKLYINY